MTDIVVLGSCRHGPYKFIAVPEKVEGKWNTEEGYQIAAKKFYPAIQSCDEVWVLLNDPNNEIGRIGEHTQRDFDVAKAMRKKIRFIVDMEYFDHLESEW
jgi:hypothetical protein